MDCAIQKRVYVKIYPQYKQLGFTGAMAYTNSNNYSVVSMIKCKCTAWCNSY